MKTVLQRLSAALLSGAILLHTAASLPLTVQAGEYERVSVHDPSVVRLEDGSYYIIGSHLGAGRSDDLMNWRDTANSAKGTKNTTFFKDIYTDLAKANTWANTSAGYDLSGNLWAPDIIWNPAMQKYCMYLSVNGVDWHSSIVLCTADDIDGPYTYKDTIVYSGFEANPANAANSYKNTDVEKVLGSNPDLSRYLNSSGRWNAEYGTNAIDPAVFYDEGGNLWMVYGSWFGGIYMLELDEQTGLRDYSVTYPTAKNASDAYMGTKVAGGYWASGEGPYIEYMTQPGTNRGYYYLFLSYGYFHPNGGYNMRIYRSESPAGPYYDEKGNSPIFTKGTDDIGADYGVRLMSNYKWGCNGYSFKAQGHNSALMDDDGRLYVIYHTKFGTLGLFHQVRVHQMIMNEDGWITATAYEYSGESLSRSGHTLAAMAGDYEFLVHPQNQGCKADWSEDENNDTAVGIAKPVNITLGTDGKITGDVTGTWSVTQGSPYMSVTVGGVTYKGAFIVQADESPETVQKMTFTATGNNMCVWGSKKAAYDLSEDLVGNTSAGSKLVYSAADANPDKTVKIGDTDLLSGVSYFITNRFNGKSLDLPGGSTAENTALQQWNLTGGSHQEWRITATEDGWCKIASMKDERVCLAVEGGTAEDGLNIVAQTYTGADNQQWRLVQKRGSYGILSKSSGAASGIDVYDWSEDNGGEIKQWNYWGGDCQLWNLTPVCPVVNDGSYSVKNVNSGLWMRTDAAGSAVQSDVQTAWQLTQLADGQYSIRNEAGLALTVSGGSSDDGADAALAAYTGSDAQKFTLYANADGSYTILTAASGGKSGLDVYGISLESGANICQWNYWGGSGQKFILEPAQSKAAALRGDVDANGKFELADIQMMQQFLLGAGTLTDWQQGDFDGSGRINAADLTLMKRWKLQGN